MTELVLIRKLIDARKMNDDAILMQVRMRTIEALRDRDLAEGRLPYPEHDGKVVSIRIDLDFAERTVDEFTVLTAAEL